MNTTTAQAGTSAIRREVHWHRRMLTVTAVVSLGAVLIALWPVLAAFALLRDLLAAKRLATTRALLFVSVLVLMENIGVIAATVIRIAEFGRFDQVRYQRRNYALQNWWGRTIAHAGIRIYRIRVEVVEPFVPSDRPFVLFVRHASFVDTFLSLLLVSSAHGIRLRYVLKRELLWDPCLDIVGHRLPNVFVRRGSDDSAAQIAAVKDLGRDLSPGEGVVIYPEGTRFTERKQRKIVERARKRGPKALADAARYRSVLPPRLGGPLALLTVSKDADAVFCAHTGLQSTVTPRQLLAGDLVGTTVSVAFRVVPRESIPRESAARKAWFLDEWAAVDDRVTNWESGESD